MGFKKSKALEEIKVPILFNMAGEDGVGLEQVEVAHIFKIPTPKVREEWQRKLLKVKGKKISTGSRSEANWYLWLNTVIRVEGYDDLPQTEDWKQYFSDNIGRIHVDSAVDMLMESLGGEEVETEKKSEPSSEQ